ncbi:MAG TPA: CAP domain-containing protein [Frankiaceae bacterium]|jgi:uncharacterized protein YkwD|nr:CAP domain-containing protein [Frankiaceae bacterium]
MRTFRAAVALVVAAVLAPAVATAAPLPLATVRYDAAGTARLYSLVDAHRRSIGLPALTRDARLETIARGWTTTMATAGTLAHNDALFTTATHTLLGIKAFGENVAYASRGVDRAHETLMDSPHHRENIENGTYAVSGFAVVVDAKGVTWVTEDFGSRPVVAATTTASRPARTTAAPPPTAKPARLPSSPAPRAPAPARARPTRVAAPRAVAAWVPPAFPRRESTTDRVDPAALGAPGSAPGPAPGPGSAPGLAAPGVPGAAADIAHPAPGAAAAARAAATGAARRAASTPLVPLAAAVAAVAVAALTAAVGAGTRRSATLGA